MKDSRSSAGLYVFLREHGRNWCGSSLWHWYSTVCPGHIFHPESDQAISVVGHSVDDPINRTLTCLIDVYFFFNGGGITKFESHSFPTFLYIVSIKMILHITFLSLTFSLLCFFVIIIIFTIWTKYSTYVPIFGASQGTLVVKNIPANAGDITRLRFDPLQNCTSAYSSILAWPILWTEEPVRLWSVGLPRVGYNWSDLECMHAPIFNHLIFCLLGRVRKEMDSQNGGWKKI